MTDPGRRAGNVRESTAGGNLVAGHDAAVVRDPALNTDPDHFILDRESREQVAFGGGAHLCVGMHLGRPEAKVALEVLLRGHSTIALTGDADAAVRRTVPGFRRFERLVVRVGE
jgi:cytochrome P450